MDIKEEAVPEVSELRVELDGTYIDVIRFGSGCRNLVALTGVNLCGIEGAGAQAASDCRVFTDDFTVWIVDRKKALPEGYSVREMAEDAFRALTLLGVRSGSVLGASQGGMLAQSLAIAHPDFVENLILCASQCRTTPRMREISECWVKLADAGDVAALNRHFFGVVYSERFLRQNAAMLSAAEQLGTKEDCAHFRILARACAEFDETERLGQIRCPTLVLGDTNDRVIGVDGSYEIAERLGCECRIYTQYSHAVFDEASESKDYVLDFLRRHSAKLF